MFRRNKKNSNYQHNHNTYGQAGIYLYSISYTFLKRTTAMYNRMDGLGFYGIADSKINTKITAHNDHQGFFMANANNVSITNNYNYKI